MLPEWLKTSRIKREKTTKINKKSKNVAGRAENKQNQAPQKETSNKNKKRRENCCRVHGDRK